MNPILKSKLNDFLCQAQNDGYKIEESKELLQLLNRKRGRQPGSKYPKKSTTKTIHSPMLGRELNISMLTD